MKVFKVLILENGSESFFDLEQCFQEDVEFSRVENIKELLNVVQNKLFIPDLIVINMKHENPISISYLKKSVGQISIIGYVGFIEWHNYSHEIKTEYAEMFDLNLVIGPLPTDVAKAIENFKVSNSKASWMTSLFSLYFVYEENKKTKYK